jgi:hypothetical protein
MRAGMIGLDGQCGVELPQGWSDFGRAFDARFEQPAELFLPAGVRLWF